ncbi:hypothetical protein M378DRAFT_85249 [Amanita muscaria Koide BX008]|uniref:RRM domain-containing protein n=1 Tax=Amanita muscaria (strain Koide BX008) TaxID=946122 RepID=A0A0C2WRE4_AMAMK|nr:hypothetical protein M378DRAFT_85249 [Amanita muscaria Koide BX008]
MTLGKRKERSDDPEADNQPETTPHESPHGSTLFVSNLPYNATSTDLQTLFSDIAPVRNAFIVTEHGTGVSKGVGYVSFSIREDATMAYDKIAKEGIALVGRKLRVQWAEQKPKVKKEKTDEKEHPPKKARPSAHPKANKSSHDPLAIRTIVISGLPGSIDSKALWKKVRKYEGAEKVEWPVVNKDGDGDSQDTSTAHAVFLTPSAAQDAIAKLHAHVFKGSLLSVTLKKRLDSLPSHHAHKPTATTTPSSTTTTTATATAATPSHANRLIVRNLPFTATESDLRSVFLPYGPIYTINMPLKDLSSTANDTTNKGFAFVWYYYRKDAERAMEKCNGMLLRAGAAEELVKADRNERVIAVDWALSKDRWEGEKAKFQEQLNKAEGEEVSSGSDSDDDDEGLGVHHKDDEGEDGSSKASDEEDAGEDDEEEVDRDEDEQPVKPQLPQTDIGTTLFIRNVPYDATEDELRTLFRSFGPLRYARITLDPITGRSRGTGFACFWNKEDADKVVQQSELLRAETTGGNAVAIKKNPFTLPSILTPDPSSSLAQNLVLHSRALDVTRAVTRDEAGRLKEEGERAREKADKRNMYLLREGVILPNNPEASSLSPADLERRTNSYNARRTLLKSNPSLYISKTRLSVRQIPVYVTDLMLKRLSLHAARTFEKEVKQGKRSGLSTAELDDLESQKSGANALGKSARRKAKLLQKLQRKGVVKQAKIVRQADRVDPITGKGKSRGYGFVETYTHADALRVLRWTNNNVDVPDLLRGWWREELERLIKIERDKSKKKGGKDKEGEDDKEEGEEAKEARLKRMMNDLEKEKQQGTKNDRRTLIVEFSIENIQVVQRRNAIQKNKATGQVQPEKKRRRLSVVDSSANKAAESVQGIRKSKEAEEEEPFKAGEKVGSIIGRKRKEKKERKEKGTKGKGKT